MSRTWTIRVIVLALVAAFAVWSSFDATIALATPFVLAAIVVYLLVDQVAEYLRRRAARR